MLLGNPSNATTSTTNHEHYLIQRDIEALDYNDTCANPTGPGWHLTTADIGSSGRTSFPPTPVCRPASIRCRPRITAARVTIAGTCVRRVIARSVWPSTRNLPDVQHDSPVA